MQGRARRHSEQIVLIKVHTHLFSILSRLVRRLSPKPVFNKEYLSGDAGHCGLRRASSLTRGPFRRELLWDRTSSELERPFLGSYNERRQGWGRRPAPPREIHGEICASALRSKPPRQDTTSPPGTPTRRSRSTVRATTPRRGTTDRYVRNISGTRSNHQGTRHFNKSKWHDACFRSLMIRKGRASCVITDCLLTPSLPCPKL